MRLNLKKNFPFLSMKPKKPNKLLRYPGGEIISKGIDDIKHHKYKSVEALIVFMASPRLNSLGFKVDEKRFQFPHLLLYKLLQKKYADSAYSQYRALVYRTEKFCNHYRVN